MTLQHDSKAQAYQEALGRESEGNEAYGRPAQLGTAQGSLNASEAYFQVTHIRRTAHDVLMAMGLTAGHVRIKENRAATDVGRPAWNIYHRAPGKRAGRVVFTVINSRASL